VQKTLVYQPDLCDTICMTDFEKGMNYDLSQVSIGNAAAIGKIRLLPGDELKQRMPMLHFIVLKDSQGVYSATCIQLRVEGYGGDIKSSMGDLTKNVLDFVKGTFKNAPAAEDAYGSLYALMEIDAWAAEWWNAYRKLQMKLSMQGIITDLFEQQEAEIKSLKEEIARIQKSIRFRAKTHEFSAEIVDFREIA